MFTIRNPVQMKRNLGHENHEDKPRTRYVWIHFTSGWPAELKLIVLEENFLMKIFLNEKVMKDLAL